MMKRTYHITVSEDNDMLEAAANVTVHLGAEPQNHIGYRVTLSMDRHTPPVAIDRPTLVEAVTTAASILSENLDRRFERPFHQ